MSDSIVLKILTAGDGGVGKTTLLRRYKEGKFVSDTQMTLGVEFTVKELSIEDTTVMLQIWDFGGQDQFRFMLQRYALGAKGALIMFDLTRPLTLDNIEEWVDIVRKGDPDIPVIFVGTKHDLTDEIAIDDDYAQEFVKEYNMFEFMKVSSKTGENIDSVIRKLAEKILERRTY